MVEQNLSQKMEDQSDSLATMLYDAALKGETTSLNELLKKDEFILDRCIIQKSCQFMQSPLHIAVNKNHVDFVKEILKQEPDLAEVVDHLKRSTPLHIAAAKGHSEIAKELFEKKPSTCFAHDQDGMTPIHVAAVNGKTEVLKMLLKAKHQASWEPTMGGETVLHLCVKNNQLYALKALVDIIKDEPELLNFGDSNGNTALHLAVAYKQHEMVEVLMQTNINKDATNKKNKTVKDIHELTSKESNEDKLIDKYLKQWKAKPAKYELKRQSDSKWLVEQNTALMVVASSIATMSFQVGMNPPGGVWQETTKDHVAGTSIMSSVKDPSQDTYNVLLASNTIALISSLSVAILLISGLPCKRYFVFILRVTLWIAVTSLAVTYFYGIGYLTSELFDNIVLINDVMDYSIMVWLQLIAILLLGHAVVFIWKLVGHDNRQKIKNLLRSRLLHSKACLPTCNTTN